MSIHPCVIPLMCYVYSIHVHNEHNLNSKTNTKSHPFLWDWLLCSGHFDPTKTHLVKKYKCSVLTSRTGRICTFLLMGATSNPHGLNGIHLQKSNVCIFRFYIVPKYRHVTCIMNRYSPYEISFWAHVAYSETGWRNTLCKEERASSKYLTCFFGVIVIFVKLMLTIIVAIHIS